MQRQQLGRRNGPIEGFKDDGKKLRFGGKSETRSIDGEGYVFVGISKPDVPCGGDVKCQKPVKCSCNPGVVVMQRKPASSIPCQIDQTNSVQVDQSCPGALQTHQCHSHTVHPFKNTDSITSRPGEGSQCFESRNQEEQKVNEQQSKETEGMITTATSKSDRAILPDKEANGVLEKMCLTKRERAYHGLPSKFHVENHAYQRFQNIRDIRYKSHSGELRETTKELDYIKTGIVAIGVEYVELKDGTRQPARVTLVSPRMKILMRKKIKPDGSVSDYRVEETGLNATALAEVTVSLAKQTKSICEMLTNHTILVSFAPAEDLHLMKITHDRVIPISSLYKKDLENGMPIDRRSLVERYLRKEYQNIAHACQAMALLIRWFSAHNYGQNVRHMHGMSDCLPIFPLMKPPTTEIECTGKQTLISAMHAKLSWRYRHILIREPDPVVQGTTVVRVHVKKWPQLKGIEMRVLGLSWYIRKMLKLPEAEHEEFRMISFPISMKSKTQAKGFFVYLDFADERRAELAIKYFTTEFEVEEGKMEKYKCELSIPRKAKRVDQKGTKQSKTYSIIENSKAP